MSAVGWSGGESAANLHGELNIAADVDELGLIAGLHAFPESRARAGFRSRLRGGIG
jgi:hypothetical protein